MHLSDFGGAATVWSTSPHLGRRRYSPTRSYELWMLPADGVPVSLGRPPGLGALRAKLSSVALEAVVRSAKLAVGTEPPGRSPTEQSTGDVVLLAPLAQAET